MAAPDDLRPGPDDRLERLIARFAPGSRLRRAWPLRGGVSAQTTALGIARPDGGIERLVVRRHGKWDLARNPQVAADEFALLQVLHAAGMAVPKPRHLGGAGELHIWAWRGASSRRCAGSSRCSSSAPGWRASPL